MSDLRFSYTLVRMDSLGAKKEYSRVPIVISRSINDILGRVTYYAERRDFNLKIAFHPSISNICLKEHAEMCSPEGRQKPVYVRSGGILFSEHFRNIQNTMV